MPKGRGFTAALINFPALLIPKDHALLDFKTELTGGKPEKSHEFL